MAEMFENDVQPRDEFWRLHERGGRVSHARTHGYCNLLKHQLHSFLSSTYISIYTYLCKQTEYSRDNKHLPLGTDF